MKEDRSTALLARLRRGLRASAISESQSESKNYDVETTCEVFMRGCEGLHRYLATGTPLRAEHFAKQNVTGIVCFMAVLFEIGYTAGHVCPARYLDLLTPDLQKKIAESVQECERENREGW